MLTRHQTLNMEPIGMIFHVIKTPGETNGRSLEMECELLPDSDDTPVHIHPAAKETFTVIFGQLEVNINGQWYWLEPGEQITVPEGAPHTFRTHAGQYTKVYNTHSPAMRFEEYFEGLSNIVTKLSGGSKDRLEMNFNATTHLSMLMKKYKAEIIPVNQSAFILWMLNAIGTLKGLKV